MSTLYGQRDNRLAPRITLFALETLIVAGAGWLAFFRDAGDAHRNTLLFVLIVFVYLRMMATIFYLLKRPLPWGEVLPVAFGFALYYLGFPLLSQLHAAPLNGWDVVFVVLFAAGCFLNTYSEWLRNQWKQNPENKGKLYTGGLFRYSMHINYFGDVLWVLALALLTWNPWALLIPLLLFCMFAFYNIPMLDRHLASKYGEAFQQYRTTTKKFIPFIY